MKSFVIATLVVCAVLTALGSLWVAGEIHYRNCLTRYEIDSAPSTAGGARGFAERYAESTSNGSVNSGPDCSVLPF